MTDKKLTDNEIIKALEVIRGQSLPYIVSPKTLRETIDLINRQQAEIERLKAENNGKDFYLDVEKSSKEMFVRVANQYLEISKTEAIKEFAERLKEKAHTQPIFDTYCGNKYMGDVSKVYVADIDNLVKEMTEPSLLDKKFGGEQG